MLARILTAYFKLLLWIEREVVISAVMAGTDFVVPGPDGLNECGCAQDDHAPDEECPDDVWVEAMFEMDEDDDDE